MKLYFDDIEFHSANFRKYKNTLSFFRGLGENFLGGHFEFDDDHVTAYGAVEKGQNNIEANLQLKPPEFDVALSIDAGAYVEPTGNQLKLNWDVNSDAWKGANWSTNEMDYSYSVRPVGTRGSIFSVSFTDNQTEVVWDVDNDPNNYNGFAYITMSSKGEVTFAKGIADKPSNPDRKSTNFPQIFPDNMVYDMNELGVIFDGAMSIGSKVEDVLVYAIHGTAKNPLILGEYILRSDSRPKSTFSVSNGKLLLNKVEIPKSGVKHNTLWWNDLSEKQVKSSGLPPMGQFEFSKDGKSGIILKKSKEEKFLTAKARPLSTPAPTDLNIYALLAMDPNAESSDGTTDVVQGAAMEDFYKIIQYYMDDNLRTQFISLNPPDMSGIEGIARDNPEANSKFYGFLSIPYLVNALANSTDKASDKLNANRAGKMLNKGFLYDDGYRKAYQDQTQQLYTLRFEDYFPLMAEFLTDQNVNGETYDKVISQDSEQWIATMQPVEPETADDKNARLSSIEIIQNLANRAIQQNLYWAYELFRYATSNYFLTWLQAQLLSPNASSQTLSMTIKKYVTLLQVLDPSGEFSVEYLNYIKQYQFMSILPQLLNLQDVSEDFNIIMMQVLQEFIDTYVNSSDPDMAEAANELQAQIELNNLQPYFDIFNMVVQQNPGGSWSNFVDLFTNEITKKVGKGALKVANLFVTGVAATSIIFVITGTTKWSDMTKVDQASFVVLSFSLFQKLSFGVIKGVIKAKAAFVASGGSWVDSVSTFFLGKWKFPAQPAEYLESGFAKWLVDTKGPSGQAGTTALLAAENAEEIMVTERSMSKMERAFGKNLNEFVATRLAAVFATINIVLSAIQLSNSDTGIEKAMNSMFLISGILEMVSIVGTWAISAASIAAGSTLATVFGVASALGVIAAVVGTIIMVVILATHKDPPTPLENFVNDQAAKAGYKMDKGVDIDYFQPSSIDDQINALGIAISETSGYDKCIRALPDHTLDLSTLSYGSDTVWEIDTDQFGYAKFATTIYPKETTSVSILLKLKNGKLIGEGSVAEEDENSYKWVCGITGEPVYTTTSQEIGGNNVTQKFLQSATFTIKNFASSKKGIDDYLNIVNGKLVVNENPTEWVLSMQGMKPSHLTYQDFILNSYYKTAASYPKLDQPGSDYGKKWSITPALPDFLEFDTQTGTISQKGPVVNFTGNFTVTVTNHYGSAKATFMVKATD